MRTDNLIAAKASSKVKVNSEWLYGLGQFLLLSGAFALWLFSLPLVNLKGMTDLGLVTVLPIWFYVSLVVLTASFAIQIAGNGNEVMNLVHVAMLIFILHGTPQMLYGTLRYSWAWKHLGIVDYIQRHGGVDPTIVYLTAYHDWPGFFSLAALLDATAGLNGALSYAGWGPVFFNLLDLGALILIYRSFTQDRRLIWLGVWFFYLGNWIGQDYFSPQAMAYFLYLICLGILLRWFRVTRPVSQPEIKRWVRSERAASLLHELFVRTKSTGTPESSASGVQRVSLMMILILIFMAIVSSHQLTPFMVISALAVLFIFQVSNIPSLALLVTVMTVTWIIYMSVGFLKANINWIIGTIGSLLHNFNSTLINLNHASPGLVLVANMDRGLTALVIGLACLGIYRRFRQGSWDVPAILLIASPFPALALNAYGGEILFRVYFFALPFMAFFAAAIFYPKLSTRANQSLKTIGIAGVSLLMLSGFVFAYYGKEQINYFSPQEVEAANYLHKIAPPGSLLMDGTWNWPLQYKNYEFYRYLSIASLNEDEQDKIFADPVNEIASYLKGYKNAYFTITNSQEAQVNTTYVLPYNSLNRVEAALINSPRFRVVYENQGATILTLNPGWKGNK